MARSHKVPPPEIPIGPDPWAVPFTDAPPGGLAEPGAAHAPEPRPDPTFSDLALGAKLFRGDALALLDMCRDGIADLIFADPPYFLSNGGFTCQGGRMVPVEKGAWDKSRSFEEDHEFNMAWLDACRRVLKPNGTLFVSGTAHNIFSVGFALQSLGYKILNDIAWFKVNPPPNLACRYFTHATETILWAKKDEKAKHTFNYDVMRAMPDPAPGKQMLSLWRITPPAKVEKRYGKHPTQKPEELLERIVLAASDPGQVVLDPFCGSGTTGVAAVRHGRRFIGFDMEGEYLAVAQKRLEDERSQLFSGQQKGAA